MIPIRLTGDQLFRTTRYDRLTTGIRRKSLTLIDEFDSDALSRVNELDTDLDWLIYAKELIENEIKIIQNTK